MNLLRVAAAAATVAALTATSSARADALPPDPCDGLDAGAACVLEEGGDGTCTMNDAGDLECTEGATSTTGTTTGTTTGGATTGGATTGGATTGGSGGAGDDGGAGGGASGGATEDDGCAVQAPGRHGATRAGAGLVFLVGALVASRRWMRRGAAPRT